MSGESTPTVQLGKETDSSVAEGAPSTERKNGFRKDHDKGGDSFLPSRPSPPALSDFLRSGMPLSQNDSQLSQLQQIRQRATGKLPMLRDKQAFLTSIHAFKKDAAASSEIGIHAVTRNKKLEHRLRAVESQLEIQSNLSKEYEHSQELYQQSNLELRVIMKALKQENEQLRAELELVRQGHQTSASK